MNITWSGIDPHGCVFKLTGKTYMSLLRLGIIAHPDQSPGGFEPM